MQIFKCEQGSDEWYAVKLGKVSASHFSEVLAKGAGKTKTAYLFRLLGERLSGDAYEAYSNKTMDRGIEVESEARTYYEALYDVVEQVGFVQLNDDVGCSPDGLVGNDGLLEIKSPQPNTHLTYIYNDRLPPVYKPQAQGNLWIAERKWCDFISFDPRVKARPFWKHRVFRDESFIKELAIQVQVFVSELKELEAKIINKNLDF